MEENQKAIIGDILPKTNCQLIVEKDANFAINKTYATGKNGIIKTHMHKLNN